MSDIPYEICKVSWETEKESNNGLFIWFLVLIRRVKVRGLDLNIYCPGVCALGTRLHWRLRPADSDQDSSQSVGECRLDLNRRCCKCTIKLLVCTCLTIPEPPDAPGLSLSKYCSPTTCSYQHARIYQSPPAVWQLIRTSWMKSDWRHLVWLAIQHTCERSLPPVECFKSATSARKSYRIKS